MAIEILCLLFKKLENKGNLMRLAKSSFLQLVVASSNVITFFLFSRVLSANKV